jgi:hypothetical protein
VERIQPRLHLASVVNDQVILLWLNEMMFDEMTSTHMEHIQNTSAEGDQGVASANGEARSTSA